MESSIDVDVGAVRTVVLLVGEIDVSLQDQVGSALGQVVTAGLPVVLDLSRARLVGATGVAFLLQATRVCAALGVPCVVRDVPHHVEVVLAALGLGDALPRDTGALPASARPTVTTLPTAATPSADGAQLAPS